MSPLHVQHIIHTLKQVLPQDKDFIPLHEPLFQGQEWEYVKECLDTGWVSSVGKFVDKFEEDIAAFVGVKKAISVVNGTAALHIGLKLVGVEENDEVLVPALTFIATVNAIRYCGAVPHFIDVDERTLGVDPYKLEEYLAEILVEKNGAFYNKNTGRQVKAVVPMHTFGHPVDLDPLLELAERYQIAVVEDAAESLGSYYKGKHTGQFGKVAALSFNGNKIITTGGGGAILTNDEELGRLAKHLTTTAKVPHAWDYVHDQIGYNYRMPNINAALGVAQLESLPDYIAQKRQLAQRYEEAFQGIAGVTFYTEQSFSHSNYWLNTLILDKSSAHEKDTILKELNEQGIMCRPIWKPMHLLAMYQDCPKMDVSVTESLEHRIINIPSSMNLGG